MRIVERLAVEQPELKRFLDGVASTHPYPDSSKILHTVLQVYRILEKAAQGETEEAIAARN